MQSVSSRAGDAAEAGEAIWFDHQQATAADFAHVGKLAALGDSLQSVNAQIGKPQIFFVLAADEAAKVDSHRLIGGSAEVQGGERDGNGCDPAIASDLSAGEPYAIPIGVVGLAFFSDQRVALRSQRIDGEFIAVASIVIGRQQHGEIVVHAEVGIAAKFSGHDAVGLAVKTMSADVEEAAVIEHADFGLFGGGQAFIRLTLAEIGDGGGARPGFFRAQRWRLTGAIGAESAGLRQQAARTEQGYCQQRATAQHCGQ